MKVKSGNSKSMIKVDDLIGRQKYSSVYPRIAITQRLSSRHDTSQHTMSAPRTLIALARSRPATTSRIAAAATRSAAFSTGAVRSKPALGGQTEGPPPDGFRIPPPQRWNEQKESVWDQAGKYFLLTEMMRGMYVLLEQFFRPP